MTMPASNNAPEERDRLHQRIVELEQALAASQQAEQRLQMFEQMIETTMDGVGLMDPEGTWVYVNAAMGTLYQADYPQDLIGRSGIEFIAPEEIQRVQTEVASAVQQSGHWKGRIWSLRMDGSRWLSYSSTFLIKDADGQLTSLVSVVRDVTAEYEIEQRWRILNEELQRQTAEFSTFHALAENAPDAIAVTDIDNTIIYANPSFHHMTGYDESVAGWHIYNFYAHPSDELQEITQTVLSNNFWQGVLTYKRQDGSTFQGHLSIFSILDADNQAMAIARIIRDLSEQVRRDQEMLDLKEQVIASQRNAIHELSTPLFPLNDDIVVMPLVGAIDTQRAQQIIESLLDGINQHQAKIALLDITGVQVVDTQVANALLQAAQAARLLGTEVILTGLRPDAAQSMVHIGVDLSAVVTRASLQAGVAYAMKRSGARL